MNRIIFTFFSFLFLLGTLNAQTTYYVSAFGKDSNNGTSSATAWQTLSKLNERMSGFVSGDQILFNKGDIFYGSITITKSGISLGAYGIGAKPIISGGKIINSGWVVKSANIWEKLLDAAEAPDKINNFYKTNVRLPISRHPNLNSLEKGYYRFEAHSANQITDNQLSGTTNWTGADVAIKTAKYRFYRTKVTSQTGTSLALASSSDVLTNDNNSGYFFVNHVSAMDQEGEWSYDATTKKIYLYSNSDPNTNNDWYSYTYTDKVISILNASNVSISDLTVKMGKSINISLSTANHAELNNISVTDGGKVGIQIETTSSASITDCFFDKINTKAIYTFNASTNATVQNCLFTNIGTDAAYGGAQGLNAIYSECNGAQFVNNRFDSIGGGAILVGGKNQLIKRNYINNALLLLDDYGAIYTNNNLAGLTTDGTIVEENIVTNCPGEAFSNYANSSEAHGIYIDNYSLNVTVRNNSVSNVGTYCYFIHKTTGLIQFFGNTAFNNKQKSMYIYLEDCSKPEKFVADLHHNIFVSVYLPADNYIFFWSTNCLPFEKSGQYKDNYLVTPFKNERLYVNSYDSVVQHSLSVTYKGVANFNNSRPNVSNFMTGPVVFDSTNFDATKDMLFFYNKTLTEKGFTLPPGFTYSDVKGKSYSGAVMLQPFTSIVLFRKGTSTGLLNLNRNLNIFPNPATNTVTLSVGNYSLTKNAVQIVSMNGSIVNCSGKQLTNGYSLNIKNLPAGIYVIKAITSEKVYTSKFVKI